MHIFNENLLINSRSPAVLRDKQNDCLPFYNNMYYHSNVDFQETMFKFHVNTAC